DSLDLGRRIRQRLIKIVVKIKNRATRSYIRLLKSLVVESPTLSFYGPQSFSESRSYDDYIHSLLKVIRQQVVVEAPDWTTSLEPLDHILFEATQELTGVPFAVLRKLEVLRGKGSLFCLA